jgi:hypothetical protein
MRTRFRGDGMDMLGTIEVITTQFRIFELLRVFVTTFCDTCPALLIMHVYLTLFHFHFYSR